MTEPDSQRLVFIDIDGTLLRGPSSERRFFYHLLRNGYIGLAQWRAFLVSGLIPAHRPRAPWRANKAYLAGLPAAEINRCAAAFSRRFLVPDIHPELADRIRDHRRAREHLVLLSGTLQPLAVPLAEALGIHETYATLCHTRNGHFAARPPERHPYGSAKHRLADRLRADRGLSWDDCTAYADSRHDLPLLEKVGQPIAVHPDIHLHLRACSAGWPILN